MYMKSLMNPIKTIKTFAYSTDSNTVAIILNEINATVNSKSSK